MSYNERLPTEEVVEFNVTYKVNKDKLEATKKLLSDSLTSMGYTVKPVEDINYLSQPIVDMAETDESLRFTTMLTEHTLQLYISDVLAISTSPIEITLFVTDSQLRLRCDNGESLLIMEDVHKRIFQ
ncbi:MAG: hypothetical protein EOM67_15165 [Spirochaetia bacterium]|nr:hypothetical protein [Spirochaetia bacterium]